MKILKRKKRLATVLIILGLEILLWVVYFALISTYSSTEILTMQWILNLRRIVDVIAVVLLIAEMLAVGALFWKDDTACERFSKDPRNNLM